MMEETCFAYNKGKCNVLKVKKCEGEGCPFFKTREQLEEDRKKVLRRINSLEPAVKRNIIELYYNGKMHLLDEVEV
jgi:hypothetical protein